ncbi:MAG: hypothetical protein U9R53_11930, partial [Chloroflexota bacterium]|nr:hypothetical protein [Chloroflexota bacterium]
TLRGEDTNAIKKNIVNRVRGVGISMSRFQRDKKDNTKLIWWRRFLRIYNPPLAIKASTMCNQITHTMSHLNSRRCFLKTPKSLRIQYKRKAWMIAIKKNRIPWATSSLISSVPKSSNHHTLGLDSNQRYA